MLAECRPEVRYHLIAEKVRVLVHTQRHNAKHDAEFAPAFVLAATDEIGDDAERNNWCHACGSSEVSVKYETKRQQQRKTIARCFHSPVEREKNGCGY